MARTLTDRQINHLVIGTIRAFAISQRDQLERHRKLFPVRYPDSREGLPWLKRELAVLGAFDTGHLAYWMGRSRHEIRRKTKDLHIKPYNKIRDVRTLRRRQAKAQRSYDRIIKLAQRQLDAKRPPSPFPFGPTRSAAVAEHPAE